ncbi:DUF2953 family protein [Scopulibacillus darangshiensis]|uniref:DUF2953 family protein n=1 Tax=Scopulibacillus darangshiensis TaxID=442528 RepID=A0A4V2SNQ1_9BACL|nr:DUF2953 domain-containing protein [Scopulibacillus darangshiensis]TCP32056.1 DUF2953 family protein [Scopulibacillus darangshiensis]
MILFIVIGIITFIVIIILFLWFFGFLNVEFNGCFSVNNSELEIKVKLWFITLLKLRVPEMDFNMIPFKASMEAELPISDEEIKIEQNDFGKWFHQLEDSFNLIRNFLKEKESFLKVFKLKRLSWVTTVGGGEAHITAVLSGMIWAVKSNILRMISQWFVLKEQPKLHVNPLFQASYAETRVSCMISFRMGQAIIAGYRFAKYWKRRQQTSCQNIQYKA